MGMPASGRSISVQVIDIIRFGDDGLVHEHWGVFDMMGMSPMRTGPGEPIDRTTIEARNRIRSSCMAENQVLIGMRAGIGAGAWIAPGLAGRLFGLDAVANPQLPYVGRLFGVRDVALAAGLQLSSAQSRRLWLKVGIVCDVADSVAGILAGRNGQISKLSTVLVTAPALLGIGLGIAGLQAAEETPAP